LAKASKKQSSSLDRGRRQKRFNRVVLIATLVIIILVTAYALTRPPQYNSIPSYLDVCIPFKGPFAYSEVIQVYVTINGVSQPIPRSIGVSGTCIHPIWTLAQSGAVHIDTPENRTYTLQDFFLVWGNSYGSVWSTFNQNNLFSYTVDNAHHISMTVNNVTNTQYEQYQFPRNANTTSNPDIIRIAYG